MSHMPVTDQPAGATAVANTRAINTTSPITGGGDLSADRTIALADAGVTNAKLASMTQATIKGRATGAGTGAPTDLTGTQATAILDSFTSALKGLVPASGGGTDNYLRADGTWHQPPGLTPTLGYITPESYGAVGDGTTDDLAAWNLTIAAAIAGGYDIRAGGPAKTYYISAVITIDNAFGLLIDGRGATVKFPSADAGISNLDSEHSAQQLRSAFYLHNCGNCTIRGWRLYGATPNIVVNVGAGVYMRRSSRCTVIDCHHVYGGSLYLQDAVANSTGTGDSLAISGGVVTLTDAAALFHRGMTGAMVEIAGATNPTNNGTFSPITYISTTQISFPAPKGVNETASFKWTVSDGDYGATIRDCTSLDPFGYCSAGAYDTTYQNVHWLHNLDHADSTGIGDSFSISGTTVTLTDASGKFKPFHQGKYIKIASSTSAANDGVYGPITYISATQISYTNAAGVTEAYIGLWWIPSGDWVGTGNGASAISNTAGTVTFTASANVFAASDVGKAIRPCGTTTQNNYGAFTIESVPAANQVTYKNNAAVSESFSGVFAVDSWDNTTDASSNTEGSTHHVYLFAGRVNVKFIGCTFQGGRTTGIKISGTASTIRDIFVDSCYFKECATAIVFGADDVNEHTGLHVSNCKIEDCATQRKGWGSSTSAITILGSSGVRITDTHFHYTRPAVGSVDGNGIANVEGIAASRYVNGSSQPIDDMFIDGVTFTVDAAMTQRPMQTCIHLKNVGQKAKWGTCTMNRASNIVTVTDSAGLFMSALDVGKTVVLKNTAIDGSYTVLTVVSKTKFTIASAGADGAVAGGTYRMSPFSSATYCHVSNIVMRNVATTGILFENTICPIVNNVEASNLTTVLRFASCRNPMFTNIIENGRRTILASIRIDNGCSWPVAGLVRASNMGSSQSRNPGIGVGGSTPVDYPLLGTCGKFKPTQAKEQVVFAYGDDHVDGDTVVLNGTTLTYKTSAPGATEFNSFASLLTALAAVSGGATYTAVDYGSIFTDTVTTQHILVAKTAQTTSDGTFYVTCSSLNPNALVPLYNKASTNDQCLSRGSGTAGPVANAGVVWSPICDWQRPVNLSANESTAAAAIAGGLYKVADANNSGACEFVRFVSATAGTEEVRWSVG